MKIRFIESPTGQPYYLSYSAGQFADLPDDLAKKLIDDQIAIKVEAGERITNVQTAEARATVSSNHPTVERTANLSGRKKSSKAR